MAKNYETEEFNVNVFSSITVSNLEIKYIKMGLGSEDAYEMAINEMEEIYHDRKTICN